MLNFQFCEHCGRAFHRLDLYREHLKRHEGVFHRCTQCSKLFKGRSELRRHISETHSTVKRRFQCENCPSTFTRAAALRKHKEKAHPINDTLTETVDSSLTNQPPVISNSMPVQNLSIASDSNIEENQELHEGNQVYSLNDASFFINRQHQRRSRYHRNKSIWESNLFALLSHFEIKCR